MRKLLISIAAAASAIAVAAPASAQAYGDMRPIYGAPAYGAPYGNAYGYNSRGFVQTMQARVQRIRYDIRNMQMRRMLSRNEAVNLERLARAVDVRIARSARGGVSAREARQINQQIRNLEVRVAREARDWNNRYGNQQRYRR